MTTSASLYEGPIFYFLSPTLHKSHGDLHPSFWHFILWQNYKPLSFSVSELNSIPISIAWVSAIVKDYMIVEYVDLLKRSYTLTLSYVMINCNCLNDWDYSLLVFNEVSDSYLKFWMNCYFSIRNYRTIYVPVLKMIMMPSCLYFFLSTPLSLSMWTCFSISVFAWGQARSKLGGVDMSILHHVFLRLFIIFYP